MKKHFCLMPFILCIFIALQGCSDEKLTPGVVATVNGEPITLHAVQTLLDSRSGSLGLQTDISLDEMKRNYGRALSMLIANTLVRQELEERDLAASENDLDLAIERISSEYGDDSLQQYLDELSLHSEDWRLLMRDHLALEIFRNQILLPSIKIDFQDVKNYYQDHQKEFLLPETVRACFLSSENRAALVSWCSSVADQDFLQDGIAQCVEVKTDEVPQPWNRELKGLKVMTCGKFRQEEGEWQSVALLERHPERVPDLSEVYPLVEKILLEPRQAAAFEQWLEQKIKKARVLISPELKDCLAANRSKDRRE